jgi:hypothetical protein
VPEDELRIACRNAQVLTGNKRFTSHAEYLGSWNAPMRRIALVDAFLLLLQVHHPVLRCNRT